ncbi:MOXD1 homolog 2-like [Lingula anatina]|uniref:MOXD1 homolog 2-like n=1 Tax=Lingula anatina TaxID=7574 RepID=A0A1S3J1Q6_LINAN|nr:MOXD1 homolog 2-like [Lingula anatina]|eukprot:XP_013404193.1 MOXD1 homolog 2-like [Lingula anatina]
MSTFTVTVAALLLAVAVSADSHDFTHHASLKDDDYYIHWKFDDTSITFNVTARTTGYVALGFSPSGGMKGADIIIGWVKDGKVTIQDRHATGKQQPVLDTKQDVEVLGGSEDGTFTTLLFKRKRQTCDDQDFEITVSGCH